MNTFNDNKSDAMKQLTNKQRENTIEQLGVSLIDGDIVASEQTKSLDINMGGWLPSKQKTSLTLNTIGFNANKHLP